MTSCGTRLQQTVALHDRLDGTARPSTVAAQRGGDAGDPGKPQDVDYQVPQPGHDALAADGADLGRLRRESCRGPSTGCLRCSQWVGVMNAQTFVKREVPARAKDAVASTPALLWPTLP